MPMKLRNVHVGCNHAEDAGLASKEVSMAVGDQSRALCNYIYRNFRAPDLDQIKPTRIGVDMAPAPKPETIVDIGIAIAEIPYRAEELAVLPFHYETVWPNTDMERQKVIFKEPDIHEFSISCLDEGLVKLERDLGYPRERILERANEFREGGYKNRWVHKKKALRSHNINAQVIFELTTQNFTAEFVVEQDGHQIFSDLMHKTWPDEHAFHGDYRELKFIDDCFQIQTKRGLFRWHLDSILDGSEETS